MPPTMTTTTDRRPLAFETGAWVAVAEAGCCFGLRVQLAPGSRQKRGREEKI